MIPELFKINLTIKFIHIYMSICNALFLRPPQYFNWSRNQDYFVFASILKRLLWAWAATTREASSHEWDSWFSFRLDFSSFQGTFSRPSYHTGLWEHSSSDAGHAPWEGLAYFVHGCDIAFYCLLELFWRRYYTDEFAPVSHRSLRLRSFWYCFWLTSLTRYATSYLSCLSVASPLRADQA